MSQTVTMTLTEFLLARIAEDAFAFNVEARSAWLDTLIAPAASRRLLAECEAKRRIVEAAEERVGGPNWRDAIDYAMRELAAVYADHPECDEAWKP